ncbi:MAG TPA: dihydroneopterin aldolase [Bacteroidia bacterium]|nr:dihydroneopterin aldolase [Bacteroidia bacterium]
MESLISVEGIECYAYHGCLDEEGVIGGRYMVDVYVEADVSKCFATDDLHDTVDYSMIADIVLKEMAVRSKLVEHVCKRISDALAQYIKEYEKISVRVTKFNPPVNGKVEKTSFYLST